MQRYYLDTVSFLVHYQPKHNEMKKITTILFCIVGYLWSFEALPQKQQQSLKDYSNPLVTKVDHKLLSLGSQLEETLKKGKSARSFGPENEIYIVRNGEVLVEAVAQERGSDLLKELMELGIKDAKHYGPMVSGYLSPDKFEQAAQLKSLRFIRPAYKAVVNIGSVTTQGDVAQKSDIVRSSFGVDGTGVTVGIISDSYNTLGGESAGIQSGDLPGTGNPNGFTAPVNVLDDLPVNQGTDEGRAMAEIVHDIAPGAELAFHPGLVPVPEFAEGVLELQAAGCDVIVDDVYLVATPFFQDGLIEQAIGEVIDDGVTYVSISNNYDTRSYESEFRPGGIYDIPGFGSYLAHDFDPGAGEDVFQKISIGTGQTLGASIISFQWDDPFASSCEGCPGADTDLDIFIFYSDLTFGSTIYGAVAFSATNNNIGGDALEIIAEVPVIPGQYHIFIGKSLDAPGPNPNPGFIKYIDVPFGNSRDEYDTQSPTVVGHNTAPGSITVGASDYRTVSDTEATIESFSSLGGTPTFFDPLGNRITTVVRNKPEIVAPDNVNTSFFPASGVDPDGDGFPNFAGSSAASPHVAGVVALMLEKSNFTSTPEQIKQALISTTIDMDDPATPNFDTGFDFKTGYGFIQADDAIQALVDTHIASSSRNSNEQGFTVASNPVISNNLSIRKAGGFTENESFDLILIDHLGRTLISDHVDIKSKQNQLEWNIQEAYDKISSNQFFYLRIIPARGDQSVIKLLSD